MGGFFTGRNAAAETAGLRSKPSLSGKFETRDTRTGKLIACTMACRDVFGKTNARRH
jgi:hypothetical protein